MTKRIAPHPDIALDARWLAFAEPLRAFVRTRAPAGVDADDVAQEVFLRLSRHRASLADVKDIEAWIFRIARSALTDAWRSAKRRALRDADVDPDALAADAEQSSNERAEIARCVRPFIEGLAPNYRRALQLTTVDGLTQEEAARREGVSLSGMKARVQRARATVLREIQHCCGLQRDARGIVRGLGSSEGGGCAPASFHRIQRRQK